MYSGQGSQYKNMGLELYDSEPVFRYWMDKLDKFFIGYTGTSVFDQLYGDKEKKISTKLIHTHLAIFMIEYAISQVLLNKGIYPDTVIGVSLGEFSAAAINEVVSPQDCMDLIYNQARIISELCPKGKMISILTDPQIYDNSSELYNNSEIVSINFKNNFTISLLDENESIITTYLKKNEIGFISLPVEYAFHSSYIENGGDAYKNYLNSKNILRTKGMAYSQFSSAAIDELNIVSPGFFWDVVRKTFSFQNTIWKVVDNNRVNYLVDLGPSGTLATSCKYIFEESNVVPCTILSPYGRNKKNLQCFYEDMDTSL